MEIPNARLSILQRKTIKKFMKMQQGRSALYGLSHILVLYNKVGAVS